MDRRERVNSLMSEGRKKMDNTIVEVKIKKVKDVLGRNHGNEQVYPANALAYHLAAIAGTVTLSQSTLCHAKAMGFTIKLKADGEVAVCYECWEDAGMENEQSDGRHHE